MPTIGTTSRPAYVYDSQTDTWIPVGIGPHSHPNYIENTLIDAKGDLLVGSAPDTVIRQAIGTNGQVLTADSSTSTGVAWTTLSFLPSQTGNAGRFLTTNGTSASWAVVDALPSQTGNAGRYLTTNGTVASWAVIEAGGDPTPTAFLLMGA
jgi:hypothetical protein